MKPLVKTIVIVLSSLLLVGAILFTYLYITIGGNNTVAAVTVPKPMVNATIAELKKQSPMSIIEQNELKAKKEMERQQREQELKRVAIEQPIARAMATTVLPGKPSTSAVPASSTISEPVPIATAQNETKPTATAEKVKVVYVKEKTSKPVTVPDKIEKVDESSYTFIEVGSTNPKKLQAIEQEPDAEQRINAIVMGEQNVFPGEPVRLRVTAASTINGVLIPKNTVFKANASIDGQRLYLFASSIAVNGKSFTLNFDGYDITDGSRGIALPNGMINQQSAQAQENVGQNTIGAIASGVGSLGVFNVGQVVNEGINMARTKNNKIFIRDAQKIYFIPANTGN
ncbi:MAG: conjugative transposon protein TraM [Cytophagales bacterium]|nr:conjugative transposon protein TraM [Cytophagales bacterium]MCA6372324.1 conjugative transposon protein TraM [Cytophagales bacterium]MCA6382470.1 conjugative transposon protein TraM [Cytophagales bacterium]